jgi:hypothetical protein
MTNKRKELKNLLKSGGVLTNINGGAVALVGTDTISVAANAATGTAAITTDVGTVVANAQIGLNSLSSASSALSRVAVAENVLGKLETNIAGTTKNGYTYLQSYVTQATPTVYTPSSKKTGILGWVADQIKASTAPILTALGGNETTNLDPNATDILTYFKNYTSQPTPTLYTPTASNAGILAWIADQIAASAAASAAAASAAASARALSSSKAALAAAEAASAAAASASASSLAFTFNASSSFAAFNIAGDKIDIKFIKSSLSCSA